MTMINHTEIEQRLKDVDFIEGSSPRWIFVGKIRRVDNPEENTTVTLLFANTSKEVNIGLGREFTKRVIKGNNAMITNSALRSLGIPITGDRSIELYINLFDFLKTFFVESKTTVNNPNSKDKKEMDTVMDLQLKPALKTILEGLQELNLEKDLITKLLDVIDILIPDDTKLSLGEFYRLCAEGQEKNPLLLKHVFNIDTSVEVPDGKWPTALGKVMLIDDSYLIPFLIEAFTENLRNYLLDNNIFLRIAAEILFTHLQDFKNFPIENYALMTQIVLKGRKDIYMKSTKERSIIVRNYIKTLASDHFGLDYKAKYQSSLLSSVNAIGTFIILLNAIFMIVTFFLSLLSILLIYSLMMSVLLYH